MANEDKKMKRYLKAVKRKLNLPSDVKERVMTDLFSSIQSRREAGQTDPEIYADMGMPADVAADLNEQMKEFAYVRSPWRWACLVLVILCSLALLYLGGMGVLGAVLSALFSSEDVGIIGGADGPVQIYVGQPSDSMLPEAAILVLILVMGIVGFWSLGHMKKK